MLGRKGPLAAFRQALKEQKLWAAEDAKPSDPKAVLEYVLSRTGKSRSASFFRKLANKVNTAGCQDRAFLRFKELLQAVKDGVSESVRRIVDEHCRALKFRSHGFEEE